MSQKNEKRWFVATVVFVFFLFSTLIVQFYKVQILENEKWSSAALSQHERAVTLPFKRGVFYSNVTVQKNHPVRDRPFVKDVLKFHLHIDPYSIPAKFKDEVSNKLAALTNEEIGKIRSEIYRKNRNRCLVMWLNREDRKNILKWWQPFARKNRIVRNAIFFVKDYKRSYPFGGLLGQVLGTVRDYKDEKSRQFIPTGGLELYFNDYLKGKLGKRIVKRARRHYMASGRTIEPVENGADIYLTINHHLQAIAEEEVRKGVEKSQARRGWAVMMDPQTGEILALAQYPFFYPERYKEYYNSPDLLEDTSVMPVCASFEPGSIMKPVTMAIGLIANGELEKPLFSPDEKMRTSGGRFPGRKKPLTDVHFHKYLNMDMAVQKSSNVYSARLVEKIINELGTNWYREKLVDVFGFGSKTGIEIPGESPGMVPTPGKTYRSGALEWSYATPWSLAMGHNIQVNSIQMVQAYSIFANGGFLVRPKIVRKVVKDGEIILDNSRHDRKRVLDEKIVERIVRAAKYITKIGGTSSRANIPKYTEAGKTGTTEKVVNGVYSKENYVSSFVGFAPAENPRFVLIVTMDEPKYFVLPDGGKNHHGGRCSAPVFREIALRSLKYLGVAPDDPSKTDYKQEVAALRKLYNEWNR